VGESLLEAFRSTGEVLQVIIRSNLLGDSVEEMIGTVGLTTVEFEASSDQLKVCPIVVSRMLMVILVALKLLTRGSGGTSDIVLTR